MAEQNDADQGGKETITENTDGKSSLIDRRSYMKLTGGAAAGLTALASGSASAATERHGITFDRVVDAVDDLGLDPTGNESATGAIQNLESGTLVTFPEGEYKLHTTTGFRSDRIGLVGEGDVKFVPPNGFNSILLNGQGVDDILVENIDIDIRADDTTAGIKLLCRNNFHVQDLEYLGRGNHSDFVNGDGETTNAFLVAVQNSGGTATLRNVVAKKGSIIGHYHKGRVGVWVGWGHQGTLRVENCDFREFGNNGMYSGRNRGKVQVVDSFFQNNNVSTGPRISGDGSYVENCVIEVDMDKYSGPRQSMENSFNPRGIIIEQGRNVRVGNEKAPGAEIRNCEFIMRKAPPRTQGAIHIGGTGRTLKVTDTRIQVDQDDVPGIYRKEPGAGSNPPSSSPHWVHLENVSITGSASGNAAVNLNSADNSTITNCCIQQTGSNREGIVLNGTSGCTIEDTTVNVASKAIDLISSDADTTNVSGDESCPAPDLSGHEADSGNTSDGSTDESTSDTSDGLSNSITIVGDQGKANYEFTVSEELAAGDYANLTNADNPDVVEGTTATGRVWGGRDNYEFNGEITDFTIDNAATVRVNGEEVDPTTLGTSNDVTFANSITIVGDQGKANYEFTVSEELAAGDYANLTNADNPDIVEGSTATGRVWGGRDNYEFNGEITDFAIDNAATVRVNGEEVDPTTLGSESSGSGSDLQNVLTIVGTETPSSYSVQVTGDIEKSTANGASINSNDVIEGSVAQGQVTGGKDSYAFSGNVSQFYLDGDATVSFDNGGQ